MNIVLTNMTMQTMDMVMINTAVLSGDMNPGHGSACSVHMARRDITSYHLVISGHVCSH